MSSFKSKRHRCDQGRARKDEFGSRRLPDSGINQIELAIAAQFSRLHTAHADVLQPIREAFEQAFQHRKELAKRPKSKQASAPKGWGLFPPS